MTTNKRVVGVEHLISLLHGSLSDQPGFEAVKEIEITCENGGLANWSAGMLAMPGAKISGDLQRAFLTAKSHFQGSYDLETDD